MKGKKENALPDIAADPSSNPPAASSMKIDDSEKLDFEAAMKELDEVIKKLEHGNVGLEESISLYERGEALRRHCDLILRSAEARIEKIQLSRDLKPVGTEPLDPDK